MSLKDSLEGPLSLFLAHPALIPTLPALTQVELDTEYPRKSAPSGQQFLLMDWSSRTDQELACLQVCPMTPKRGPEKIHMSSN